MNTVLRSGTVTRSIRMGWDTNLSANPFARTSFTLYGLPKESAPSKETTFFEGGLIPMPLFSNTELPNSQRPDCSCASELEKSSQKGRETGTEACVLENILDWVEWLLVAIGYSTSWLLAESGMVKSDAEWNGDDFVKQSNALSR